jgi:hypothetical protein
MREVILYTFYALAGLTGFIYIAKTFALGKMCRCVDMVIQEL